jgi:hypothetical protein
LTDTIEASEFRFDHKKMKNILDDVQNKYLPMLETKKRQETEASWKALHATYQKLETERRSLKTLSCSDLPKYKSLPDPDASCLVNKNSENITPMWGTFYPDVVLEGNIVHDAKIGLDVVIYNEDDKASRPWVGVIKDISEIEQTFTIQWFRRAAGGGIRYKEDIKEESLS